MAKIIDLIAPNILGEYYTAQANNDEPFIGDVLFPAKKQVGLRLDFIKGANNQNVLLKPSAFDSIAELRNRIGFETMEMEMPLFRESMQIKEKEAQDLMMLMDSPKASPYVKATLRKIYDDVTNLVKSARRVNERMRMELLSNGAINIASVKNGVGSAYAYEYKDANFSAKNMETLTSKWDVPATATPIEDLQRWQQAIEDLTGSKPTNAIMTRKTFNYILKADEVKGHFTAMLGGNIIVTEARVKELLMQELGLNVIIYNKKYVDYDGSSKNYYPDDKVTLFPDGALGNTHFGTTNEEAQLTSGLNGNVAVVDTGVAIMSTEQPHPVNETVFVAEIALPSFERMNEIFIATVA